MKALNALNTEDRLALRFYRARAWGSAVLAGLFAGAMIMFSGVFWFSLVGR